MAIYDVPDNQPLVLSGASGIIAGLVTSRTFALVRGLQDPLALVGNDAANCVPPAGNESTYAARITLTFNANIEVVGATGLTCTPPPTVTSVNYGGSSLVLQPVGEPTRRRALSDMLFERRLSSTVTCPMRRTSF